MQQVDKKRVQVKYFFIVLVSIFFIFGCSSKNEYTSSARSFDKNITKDQLLHAAKRVFKITDENAFIIDSYRNELNVTKPKATYKLYTMDMQNDNFNFKVDDNETKSRRNASISISRTYGIEEENRHYIEENSFTYELFWDRVEYLLGLKESWRECNYIVDNGFMCDIVDLDNSWFTDKNLIDLNTTKSDKKITKETINLSKIYTKGSPNKSQKELRSEVYMINDYKKAPTRKDSLLDKDPSLYKEKDNFVKSYKLPTLDNVDTNATVQNKKKIDHLNNEKIEEINLDNNSTNR